MTEKLFYENPYICEAECEVINIVEKAGKFEIELKSTPFYAEGGGQPSDTGFIDDIRVENVYEKDEVIYHVISARPNDRFVKCRVDIDRRIDHIQQHSGEHLISAAFFKLYKVTNAGFHLGEEYVTVDIEIKDMTEEMIAACEMEANRSIYKNEKIHTYYLEKEEAEKLPLRKAIKAEGKIRIVQMGEQTDFSACCGTHVNYTGEVGIIKIIKYEKYKGMTRIYVKCGKRALLDYQWRHNSITELSRSLSSEASEVVNKVNNLKEEISQLRDKMSSLYSKIAAIEAEKLEQAAAEQIIAGEYEDEGFEFLEKLIEKFKNKKYIMILSSSKDLRLILAHNGEFEVDCGELFKTELREYGGRGGGNLRRAQANFENIEALRAFSRYLCQKLT